MTTATDRIPAVWRRLGWLPRLLLGLVLTISGIGPAANARADAAAELQLETAIEAYAQAMESSEREGRLEGFRRSERLFRAVAEAGVANAELQANLGNAALQAEHLGAAILAYRRALLLEPGLERARQNLEHARGLLPEWVPTPSAGGLLDSFFGWHRTTSGAARANAAALLFAIAMLGLAASIAFRTALPRLLALPAGLGWLVLMISLALDPSREASREAVVVVDEAMARAADSINAPRRFSEPLPGGTEVTILEDRGGWLQIELHNGRNAWLTANSLERVTGG